MLETKDIAEILDVHSNTVRKYALALEAQGYVVQRDDNNDRKYSEVDATVFRELQALRQRSGLSVEKCAEVIAARHREPSGSVLPSVIEPDSTQIVQHEMQHGELLGAVQTLADLNRQQADEIARLHKRMDEQNNNISVILRETLETKRLLAAAAEKPARKGWMFWRKAAKSADPDPEAIWKKKAGGAEAIYDRPGREKK
ncbi:MULTISPECIES: MerR family transcriptional regulator [unclassified Paenibacillus]|uniref:MerR family transcriptional regulator n=1 Tax=unclassified Paenibacillus TaxID=185978 RepID=UPI000417D4D4|nr:MULTISPECIES: MerR family transcriptional regulator [unclassified Paenibacillus]KGP85299.1 hypothetical protein P364_0101390 [Paenibacillus sp. MAEPY2]KGP88145.1 hypothetical protein P363_0108270 [Paenibacillus sp. MAEPY1]